jgi:hypothetical protein
LRPGELVEQRQRAERSSGSGFFDAPPQRLRLKHAPPPLSSIASLRLPASASPASQQRPVRVYVYILRKIRSEFLYDFKVVIKNRTRCCLLRQLYELFIDEESGER